MCHHVNHKYINLTTMLVKFILLAIIVKEALCKQKCNKDWVLCSKNECVPKECLNNINEGISCGQGQGYCNATKSCVPYCPSQKKRNANVQSCPGELVLCFGLGKCTTSLECSSGNHNNICSSGAKFCPYLGYCTSGLCHSSEGQTSCPVGHIFCNAKHTCTLPQDCDESGFSKKAVRCPSNYIFCLQSRTCMPQDSQCEGTSVSCPLGMTYCMSQKKCSKDCPEVGRNGILDWDPSLFCPSVSNEYMETSCLSSNVCGKGAVCCRDKITRHSQCTNYNKVRVNSVDSTCSNLADGDVPCSETNPCIPNFICCNNVCKTANLPENICQLGTLSCSATKECVQIGKKCGQICSLDKVYCVITDSCTLKSDCELDRYISIPIMLPGPLFTSEAEAAIQEFRFNEIFNEELNGMQISITEVEDSGGEFAYESNNNWIIIKSGDSLSANSNFRYKAPTISKFGVAYMKFQEQSTENEHIVVELLAPVFDKLFSFVNNEIILAEDKPTSLSLSEVVTMNEPKISHIGSIDMLLSANANGLLDIGHQSTVTWAAILTRGNKATVDGISIKFKDPNPLQQPLALVMITADNGVNWFDLPFIEPLEIANSLSSEDFLNMIIKIEPTENNYGKLSLIFSPIYSIGSQLESWSDHMELQVEILPINDAPKPKSLVDPELLPSLIDNTELDVGSIASYFYEDPENDALSLAVVYAQQSDIGDWEYSKGTDNTFNKIENLNENPLSSLVSCLDVCHGAAKLKRIKRSLEIIEDTPQEASTIKMLFLPRNSILRYKLSNSTTLKKLESVSKTALVAFAYEYIKYNKTINEVINVTINDDNSFLSEELLYLYAVQKSCDGFSVINEEKVFDECNVCGGDGTSCIDCAGIVGGTKIFDECTEKCVDPSEVTHKDCLNKCGEENHIVQVGGNDICYPVNQDTSVIACEGDMFLDSCGQCSSNTDVAINCCNDDCEIIHYLPSNGCGSCNITNQDCPRVDIDKNQIIDIALGSVLQSTTETSGILFTFSGCLSKNLLEIKNINCTLYDQNSNLTLKINSGEVKRTFNIETQPKSGSWQLECTSENFTVSSTNILTIVDSRAISIESVTNEITSGTTSQVFFKAPNSSKEDLQNAVCFINQNDRIMEFALIKHENGSLSCYINTLLDPGTYSMGIVLSPSLISYLKENAISVPSIPITIKSKVPEVIKASFNPSFNLLEIEFDTAIENPNCNSIFDQDSLQPGLGNIENCKVEESKLSVYFTGDVDEEADQFTVSFSQSSGILQKGSSKSGNSTEGQITVEIIDSKPKLSMILLTKKLLCDSEDFGAIVTYDQSLAPVNSKVTWKITSLLSNAAIDSSMESIKSVAENAESSLELSFSGNLLVINNTYAVLASLVTEDGYVISVDSKSFTRTDSVPLLVNIIGRTAVSAMKDNDYVADFSQCGEEESTKLEYFWDIKGLQKSSYEASNSKLKILKGSLISGKEYKIYVAVLNAENGNNAEAEMNIQVEGKGIKIITSTDNLVTGTNNEIKLDASKTIDLDNLPGDIKFRWSCRMGSMPCISSNVNRLENEIPEEELESSVLVIPPSTMVPGRYVFNVEASKDRRKESLDIFVEVTNQFSPLIIVKQPSFLVNIEDKLVIDAEVSIQRGALIYWRITHPLDGIQQLEISTAKYNPYPIMLDYSLKINTGLEIPKNLLEPGNEYKFTLYATYVSSGATSSADAKVNTIPVPIPGTFSVSPAQGNGFDTLIKFEANEWSSGISDSPLPRIRIGYESSSGTVWLSEAEAKSLAFSTTLPPGASKGAAEICNAEGACKNVESQSLTISTPPLTESITSQILSEMENIDSLPSLLTYMNDVMSSYMNSEATKITKELATAVVQYAMEKIETLTRSVNNGFSVEDVSSVIKRSVTLCDNLENMVDSCGDFYKNIVQLADVALPKIMGQSSAVSTLVPVSITVPDKRRIINFPTDAEGVYRPKRSINKKIKGHPLKRNEQFIMTPSNPNKISAEFMEASMLANEAMLLSKQTTTEDKMASYENIIYLSSLFLSSLCASLKTPDDEMSVSTKTISYSVIKYISSSQNQLKPVAIGSSEEGKCYGKSNANCSYVEWGSMLSNYNEWNCQDNEKCYGACLGTAKYNNSIKAIYKGLTYQSSQTKDIKTPMVQSMIMDPYGKETIPQADSNNEIDSLLYDLIVNDDDPYSLVDIQCFGLSDSEQWSEKLCKKISTTNATTPFRITCKCSGTGYVTAIKVAPGFKSSQRININGTLTEPKTDSTVYKYTFSIVIQANYYDVVAPNPELFKKNMTTHIATKMQIDENQINITKVVPGSIVVDVEISSREGQTRSADVSSLQNLSEKFLAELKDGICFDDDENNCMAASELVVVDKSELPLLIGGIIGIVLISVAIIVGFALYFRHKNRQDKVHALNGTGNRPTYRKMNFEPTLDGSYQKSFDDDIYRKRIVQTPGSNDSGFGSPVWSSDRPVPSASRYTPPSRKLREQTERDVPEHVMKRLYDRDQMPGTPD